MEKLLNMKEIAAHIGIGYDTIKGWRKAKLIPYIEIAGRPYFRVESLEKWLNELEDKRDINNMHGMKEVGE